MGQYKQELAEACAVVNVGKAIALASAMRWSKLLPLTSEKAISLLEPQQSRIWVLR